MTRVETLTHILDLTGKAGNETYFDRLAEKTDTYLTKLLRVVEKLKK